MLLPLLDDLSSYVQERYLVWACGAIPHRIPMFKRHAALPHSASNDARFNLLLLASQLGEFRRRPAGFVILNLSWHPIIRRNDRPTTLFQLDPLFRVTKMPTGEQYQPWLTFEMANVLDRLIGRYILFLNALTGICETLSRFQVGELGCSYSILGQGRSKEVTEVITTKGRSLLAATDLGGRWKFAALPVYRTSFP